MKKSTSIDPKFLTLHYHGGVMVHTSAGLIQFGMPAGIVKDVFRYYFKNKAITPPTLNPVYLIPHYYVFNEDFVPKTTGMLPIEFLQYIPFYLYHERFFKEKRPEFRINFITQDAAQAKRLGDYLRISLLGPTDTDFGKHLNAMVAAEYPQGTGISQSPDMRAELLFHKSATPEELTSISCFQDGVFRMGGVTISTLDALSYKIEDQGHTLGVINLEDFSITPRTLHPKLNFAAREGFHKLKSGLIVSPFPVVIPITTDHGFATHKEEGTSGFLILNQKKAIVIDPPYNTVEFLKENGLLQHVNAILITHGHGDHLTPAFTELLELVPEIKIYSSPTVLKMVERQIQLALNISWETTQRWHTTTIGMQQFCEINGLWFRFDYGFHSTPAFGFEIWDRPDEHTGQLGLVFTGDSYVGKDIYTGDLFVTKKVMTESRRQNILRVFELLIRMNGQKVRPWILIEAGIAPLHTPAKDTVVRLAELAIQHGVDTSQVLLYHNTDVSIEAEEGAQKWKAGLERHFLMLFKAAHLS